MYAPTNACPVITRYSMEDVGHGEVGRRDGFTLAKQAAGGVLGDLSVQSF